MHEVKSVTIRCPTALVQASEALLARRRAERPYERVSIGDVFRELLARGLDTVAQESKINDG
jgi:hypothetical protein